MPILEHCPTKLVQSSFDTFQKSLKNLSEKLLDLELLSGCIEKIALCTHM